MLPLSIGDSPLHHLKILGTFLHKYEKYFGVQDFFKINIYLRRDLINLKRENEVICKIVIFIIKSESSEPEILLLFPWLPAWFKPGLVEESR